MIDLEHARADGGVLAQDASAREFDLLRRLNDPAYCRIVDVLAQLVNGQFA
ncbi:hypothetical protein [Cupriavidus metallidurans]|uniref:hypothetical protein n=1 Tax=Cupriavidus metallidurans TaxID=119219 RepID=UPI001F42286B|nr:hypothetical protein [Cupriavidus metallidurans]